MTTRRSFIRYLGAGAAALATRLPALPVQRPALSFAGLAQGADERHHLPPGYEAQVLLRWGDVIIGQHDGPAIAIDDPALQLRSFGYNNDYVAFMPLPRGSASVEHGLLCVNHEYTNPAFMWPDVDPRRPGEAMSAARTAIELAAIGHSTVEVRREQGHWRVVNGRYNRRVSAASGVALAGPAAGHRRLRTGEDPGGRKVAGILNPCSGGKTPWGTVLIAEENFNFAFSGRCDDPRERRNHARYGVGHGGSYGWWARHLPRYDVAREPHEANRYGWVVELDPYDPHAIPRKRTALGRFKHEAATCVLDRSGRVVVYSGDDEIFEYLYRYVSHGRFSADNPPANRDLLDDGELHVARFHDDGTLDWLPLRHGHGPLTPANGFADQADVLIETRRAADLLGATRLDRPEDVETNPIDGSVYAVMTNNLARDTGATDAANPRARNRHGHILRLLPPGAPGSAVDHAAPTFHWEMFALAGDPARHARYPGALARESWFSAPDNCAFDRHGRLWIATDQGRAWRATGFADGLWACGENAAGDPVVKCFFRAPIGAEVCGPEFTADGSTLFLAVQHPGIDGLPGSRYKTPATRWPDFDPTLPPRPSVIAIRRTDGGPIGS